MDTTGKRIKHLRLKKGISQSSLSRHSGITSTQLQQYEYGTRHPKDEQLNKIAYALGVSPTMLKPLDVDTVIGLVGLIYEMHDSYHGIEIVEENGFTSIRLPNTLQAMPAKYALHVIKEFMSQPPTDLPKSSDFNKSISNEDLSVVQPDTRVTLGEELKWQREQLRFLQDLGEILSWEAYDLFPKETI